MTGQQQQQSNPVAPQKIGMPKKAMGKVMKKKPTPMLKANVFKGGKKVSPKMPKKFNSMGMNKTPSLAAVKKSVRKTMGYA